MRMAIVEPGAVRVEATEAELQAMRDNGLELYWTPGADWPYWASRPNFQLDEMVADVYDFLEASGYDAFSELQEGEEGELLSLTVTRP